MWTALTAGLILLAVPAAAENRSEFLGLPGAAEKEQLSPRREIAQFPWSRRRKATPTPPMQPGETVAPVQETAAPAARTDAAPGGDYVSARDLASQLRRIDPNARVDWQKKVLRIVVNGQKFSLFPSGNEIVVNGNVEKVNSPLRVYRDEVYVPQGMVDRIGAELEKAPAAVAATITPAVSPAAPTPHITATPSDIAAATLTPGADLLPAGPTPATPVATRVATPAFTPVPQARPTAPPEITVTPEMTPLAPTPALTPVPTAPPAPTQTPWRIPTPAPTPLYTATPVPTAAQTTQVSMASPTASPIRTPRPRRTTKPSATAIPEARQQIDIFNAALREKADIANARIPQRKFAELQALASAEGVRTVVVDADYNRSDSPEGRRAGELALQVAQKLQLQLQAKGIRVVMTRTAPGYVPLGKKLEIINTAEAQLLITIGVGISEFPELNGYRILFASDTVDYNAQRVGSTDGPAPPELFYLPFVNRNKVLGSALQSALQRVIKEESVGTNPLPLYVAKRAPMASVMVIIGYQTNPGDSTRLADSNQQDLLAAAMAQGITDFSSHLGGDSGARR